MPVIAANRVGKEEFPERREKTASSITFHGGSFITGPTGEIVAQVPCSKHDLAFTAVTGPSLCDTHLNSLPMFIEASIVAAHRRGQRSTAAAVLKFP